MSIRITTLIENSLGEHLALKNEHGISFVVETDSSTILFDTGQSGKFIENAEKLNIDLSKVEHVVLSHGHYDHTGGFKDFVKAFGNSFELNIRELLLDDKFGYDGNSYQFLGNDFNEAYLMKNNIKTKFITKDIEEITDNIYVMTNFEKTSPYEKLNNRFYKLKDGNYVLDEFKDEVVVILDTEKGLVILLGCSHPGVVNILATIKKRMSKKIYAVLGGTHLVEADEERVKYTIDYFEKASIELIGTSHCTGEYAMNEISKKFGSRFFHNSTGTSMDI